MIKQIFAVLILVFALVFFGLNSSFVKAAGAGGVVTLDLNPVSAQTGMKLLVSGRNAPNGPLSLWIAPESNPSNSFQLMAAIQPKEDGSWDAQVYVPREWPRHAVVPGKYLVTVQNEDLSYQAQGSLTVLPVATATPASAAKPGIAGGVVSWLRDRNPILPIVILIAILGGIALLVNRSGKPSA